VIQNAQGQTETLHTTAEHPFWVTNAQSGAQWLKASLLAAGMQLIDRSGNTLSVQSQTALNETATVYNIQVQEHSTYHVGAFGTWVHNANCCDVPAQNPITPSNSGNLSKTKLGNEAIALDTPPVMQPAIKDIQVNGDITGAKTENLVNTTLKADPNVTVLDGTKYGANNGLDHVVQFKDPQTGQTMTMIIDSKQLAKNGSTSLDPNAAGGTLQLSQNSLKVVLNNLPDNSPAKQAILNAQFDGTLIKAVSYVDKTTGELKIVPVNVPNPKK
jgi:filamentous hemagglutinin